MPRKVLPKTHLFPYHIVARSNNKEWFYLPADECWNIFCDLLSKVNMRYHFQIHAFILMSNHYHLIGTPSEKFPLPKVMEWFQRSANRIINDRAGRINHLFGGPYKACLIESDIYYYHVVKYLYRNPITAAMTIRVEDYSYSTLRKCKIPLSSPISEISGLIPKDRNDFLEYLNQAYSPDAKALLDKSIKKTRFTFPSRLPTDLKSQLLQLKQSQKVSAYP